VALLVYYSSKTGNTHHFVHQLGSPYFRIDKADPQRLVERPFVLVLPTYAGGDGRGAVSKAVIHFLNEEHNRDLSRAKRVSFASKKMRNKCISGAAGRC